MEGSEAIRALTFNIRLDTSEKDMNDKWSGERCDGVAAFLRWANADIYGLQEVQPAQLQFLSEALAPEYGYVGIGREADGRGEASPLFFKKDRFAVVKWETFWLSSSSTLKEPGSKFPRAGCPRVLTCALFRQRDNKEFFAFNTHLDHRYMYDGNCYIQRGQAEMMVGSTEEQGLLDVFTDGSKCPRVIMGDFNSTLAAGAPPVLCAADYQDCSKGDMNATFCGFDDSGFSYGADCADGHIDWIFVRGVEYSSYTVYDAKYMHSDGKCRNASDHCPVAVTLHFDGVVPEVTSESCKVKCVMNSGGKSTETKPAEERKSKKHREA